MNSAGARMGIMLFLCVLGAGVILGQSTESIANSPTGNELAPIKDKDRGLWGYADKSGEVVIKPQFTRAQPFSEGLALVWADGIPLTDSFVKSFVKMGYIDATGHWVIHSRFKYYFFVQFSDGVVPFRQVFSKWGYMDKTGKIVVRPRFDWAGSFSNGRAAVLLDGRCAQIDKNGKITSESETVLPRQRYEQDRHGTYLYEPNVLPCP